MYEGEGQCRKMTETQHSSAIIVRNAYKAYGYGNNKNTVLAGLNMTVPKGCIYGLLGSSGCGKTTLLSCIVGRKVLNSGDIWVFGERPCSKMARVPGPSVGYMPQDVALYQKFSVFETFQYFGKIFGKTISEVKEIGQMLVTFLQLPEMHNIVNNLSGGQQRRLSLAVALFNNPELLILDEPTVGVDAILRERIWDYLVNLTTKGNTTIIITTHYIDETRRANMIGLMRNGRLLAEESPTKLLTVCGTETLEDAFLKLSQSQQKGSYEFQIQNTEFIESKNEHKKRLPGAHREHMNALIWKNFLWMRRNVNIVIFLIWFPILNLVGFYYTIGQEPRSTPVAVVNHEFNGDFLSCPVTNRCDYEYLSCHYLKLLQSRDVYLVRIKKI